MKKVGKEILLTRSSGSHKEVNLICEKPSLSNLSRMKHSDIYSNKYEKTLCFVHIFKICRHATQEQRHSYWRGVEVSNPPIVPNNE